MSGPALAIGLILAVMIALFVRDRLRHDLVAAAALLASVFAAPVPASEAFAGFSHPAVVTVAAVLILSGVLQSSGAADALMRAVMPAAAGPRATVAVLTGLAAAMSAFMNNVGALALLMPLAFGSILGGMTTLIGTPPNLIVVGFRAQTGAPAFAMFDFAPVGLAVAAAGLAFIAFLGWRLVPERRRAGSGGFEIGAYLTEVRVPENSKTEGLTLHAIESLLDEVNAQVVGLVRDNRAIPVPDPFRRVHAGDILVIEADPPALREALGRFELKLEEDKPTGREKGGEEACIPGSGEPGGCAAREKIVQSGEVALAEMVLLSDSGLIGRTATEIRLRTVYHLNLLAVSRKGERSISRLRSMRLAAGDVLLLQGESDALNDFAARFGCDPLAERPPAVTARRGIPDRGDGGAAGAGTPRVPPASRPRSAAAPLPGRSRPEPRPSRPARAPGRARSAAGRAGGGRREARSPAGPSRGGGGRSR
jgi:Trk K+ transport system NAD-binding subunit